MSWSARDLAILAVDLAPGKQAAVVCDHDLLVLGRRVFTGSAWCIEQILAEPAAARAGFAGLVLACEPARHRWEPLAVTAGRSQSLIVATRWRKQPSLECPETC